MELPTIQSKIYEVRGVKVMLDFDLAQMYEVETKRLKEQVRRNVERFPSDFMFELSIDEWENLRTQIATSSWGGSRYAPFAFSEHGIIVLSSVLHSEKAIQVNIQVVRAFIALRQYALGYTELNRKLEEFMIDTNIQFGDIYAALTALASQKEEGNRPRNPIGYKLLNE